MAYDKDHQPAGTIAIMHIHPDNSNYSYADILAADTLRQRSYLVLQNQSVWVYQGRDQSNFMTNWTNFFSRLYADKIR